MPLTRINNRLLDDGERGLESEISAVQYQAVAKISKATATRHLGDLLEKGCITAYRVAVVAPATKSATQPGLQAARLV